MNQDRVRKRREQRHISPWAFVIAAAAAILAVVYGIANPIFEAPDEIYHFAFIDHFADTFSLPVQDPAVKTMWAQEGSQPPLYHMAAGLLILPFDRANFEKAAAINPHNKMGITLPTDNKNWVLHNPALDAFPWHGTALAVHALRLLSAVMGGSTALLSYFVAKEAFPGRRSTALLAEALTAFNPMFIFVSGAVTNDTLAVLLSSTVALILVRALRKRTLSRREAIGLGVLLALGALTKLSCLTFYVMMGIILLILMGRRYMNWREVLINGAIIAGLGIIIAGWWYVRNFQLYGELFGTQMMISVVGARNPVPTYLGLLPEFQGFAMSYFGVFGVFNVLMPEPFYWLGAVLLIWALLGQIAFLLKRWSRKQPDDFRMWAVIGFQILLVLFGVMSWTRQTPASQGRLMFPAITLISLILALGIISPIPHRYRKSISPAVMGVLGVIAVLVPFVAILPAYAPPPTPEQIPASASVLDVRWGPFELLAYELDAERGEPGGTVPVTFYWQLRGPVGENYSLYIHLLGRDGEIVNRIDSYPGRGLIPTSAWEPGVILQDRYDVLIPEDVQTPVLTRLRVGWWYEPEDRFLEPELMAGGTLSSVTLAGVPVSRPDSGISVPSVDQSASFGGAISLIGYDLPQVTAQPGGSLTFKPYWSCLKTLDRDYTLFVQLVNEAGELHGTGDSPPLGGDYPTSYWIESESFVDSYTLNVFEDAPEGAYSILIGWYHPGTGERIPARDRYGEALPDNALPLSVSVEIVEEE